MNSTEIICYLTEKQSDRLFEIARKFPADKLNWKPSENSRSALDQLQEIATAIPIFLPGIVARKLEWNQELFEKWSRERATITSLDELERLTKESNAQLEKIVRSTPESELGIKVDMPFPGEYRVVDLLTYHLWNMGYHEGQINYLLFMIEGETGV